MSEGIAELRDENTRLRASLYERRKAEEAASNEVERLKAELARLTPSGQVVEDEAHLLGTIETHEGDLGPDPESRAALFRIAAKAQETETLRAALEHEVADRRKVESEREAAVADNAALLGAIRVETVKECDLQKVAARNGSPLSCHDVITDKSLWCARCRLAVVEDQPHPGSALLKQMQEQGEVVKALLEAGERLYSLSQHDEACKMGVGDDEAACDCAMRTWRQALCDALRRAGRLP